MVLLILAGVSFIAAVIFGVMTWRVVRDDRRRSAARVAALAAAIDGDAIAAVEPPLVVETGLRIKIAAGVVAATVVIGAVAAASIHRAAPTSTSSPAATGASLELLSMRPERAGDTLTVTGLVRNRSSASADHLVAVVFAFDSAGSFLASARAPLEFTTLAPGDESPFRVSIPDVAAVGRYRVSFRTDTGLVRHVDRRTAQIARN